MNPYKAFNFHMNTMNPHTNTLRFLLLNMKVIFYMDIKSM